MNKNIKKISFSAVIASLYISLTILSSLFGLDKGVFQLRLSEILCILPCFSATAISGLTIGCFLSGILCGAIIPDIVLGTIATLIGAIGTYYIAKRIKIISALPPIISNTLIIPLVLKYCYKLDIAIPIMAISIFISEFILCGVIGTILIYKLPKKIIEIFK